MADIVITLPASVRWSDYQKELHAAANGAVMNFRLPSRPKNLSAGDRCLVVHKGLVRGWMFISAVVDSAEGFTCSTTGRRWSPGVYVQRTGEFYYLTPPPKMKGFQGYRYWTGPTP